jgi:hypothetical protein
MYHAAPDFGLEEPRRSALYTFVLNNPFRYSDPDGRQVSETPTRIRSAGDEDEVVPPFSDYTVGTAIGELVESIVLGTGCILGCNPANTPKIVRDKEGHERQERTFGRKSTKEEAVDIAIFAGVGFAGKIAGGIVSGRLRPFLRRADDSLSLGKAVPQKVVDTLEHVRQTGKPPAGFVGGRTFRNAEGRLPSGGRYREFDVDPRPLPGNTRNAERLVVDENSGRAWYTDDHYGTFTEVQ